MTNVLVVLVMDMVRSALVPSLLPVPPPPDWPRPVPGAVLVLAVLALVEGGTLVVGVVVLVDGWRGWVVVGADPAGRLLLLVGAGAAAGPRFN